MLRHKYKKELSTLWQEYCDMMRQCFILRYEHKAVDIVNKFFDSHLAHVLFLASTLHGVYSKSCNLEEKRKYILGLYELYVKALEINSDFIYSPSLDSITIQEIRLGIQIGFSEYPLLKEKLHNKLSRIEDLRDFKSSNNQVHNKNNHFDIESFKKTLNEYVMKRKWTEATNLVVFTWINCKVDSISSSASSSSDARKFRLFCSNWISTSLSELEQFWTYYCMDYQKFPANIECIYFLTHVILVIYGYGNENCDFVFDSNFTIDFFCKIMQHLCQLIERDPKKMIKKYIEPLIEVGVCALLMKSDSIKNEHSMENESIKNQDSLILPLYHSIFDIISKYEKNVNLFNMDSLTTSYHTNYLIIMFISLYLLKINSFNQENEKEKEEKEEKEEEENCISTGIILDSTPLLTSSYKPDELRQRMDKFGFLLFRQILPKEIVQNTHDIVKTYVDKRILENSTIPITSSEKRFGGFLVNTSTGWVYGEESDSEERQSEWRNILNASKLKNYLLGRDERDLFSILLNNLVKSKTLKVQSDLTWFRAKLHKEKSNLHCDYFHFLESGSLYSAQLQDDDANAPMNDNCEKCNSSLSLYTENAFSEKKEEVEESEQYIMQCDLCHRSWHAACVPYVDSDGVCLNTQEWHCRNCIGSKIPSSAYTCWIPLQDLDQKTQGGLLQVWPGTHYILNGFLDQPAKDCLLPYDLSKQIILAYPDLFPSWTPNNMQVGDVILFDIRTIHAALPNKDPYKQPRLSIDARLC